jgi:hypothetical protein
MPQRAEIKIKLKSPNEAKLTYIHTRTACEPPKKGKRERELSFSEPPTEKTPNGIKFAGPQTKNETHLTLPLSGSD